MAISDSVTHQVTVEACVADHFSDVIDSLYRHAITEDSSVWNQVAYASYVAEHGRFLEGLQQFGQIVEQGTVDEEPELLHEIVDRVSLIEAGLEDEESSCQFTDGEFGAAWGGDYDGTPSRHQDHAWGDPIGSKFASAARRFVGETIRVSNIEVRDLRDSLPQKTLDDVRQLINALSLERVACEQQRSTGLMLLKLAHFCGRYHRHQLESACLRHAILYLHEAAVNIRTASRRPRRGVMTLANHD